MDDLGALVNDFCGFHEYPEFTRLECNEVCLPIEPSWTARATGEVRLKGIERRVIGGYLVPRVGDCNELHKEPLVLDDGVRSVHGLHAFDVYCVLLAVFGDVEVDMVLYVVYGGCRGYVPVVFRLERSYLVSCVLDNLIASVHIITHE